MVETYLELYYFVVLTPYRNHKIMRLRGTGVVAVLFSLLLLMGEVIDTTFFNNVLGFVEKQREVNGLQMVLPPNSAIYNKNMTYALSKKKDTTHKEVKDVDFHLGSGVFFDVDLENKKVTIDEQEQDKRKKLKMKLRKILKDYEDGSDGDDDDDCDDDDESRRRKFFGLFGAVNATKPNNKNETIIRAMGAKSKSTSTDDDCDDEDDEDDFEKNKAIRIGSGFYFDVTLDKDKGELDSEEISGPHEAHHPPPPTEPRPPPPGYYNDYHDYHLRSKVDGNSLYPQYRAKVENTDLNDGVEKEDGDIGKGNRNKLKKLFFWPFSVNDTNTLIQLKSVVEKSQVPSSFLLSHADTASSNLFTEQVNLVMSNKTEETKNASKLVPKVLRFPNSTSIANTTISFTNDGEMKNYTLISDSNDSESDHLNWWEMMSDDDYANASPKMPGVRIWVYFSTLFAIATYI